MSALTKRWLVALAVFAVLELVVTIAVGVTIQSNAAAHTTAIGWWLALTWLGSVGVTALGLVWAQRALAEALTSLAASVRAAGRPTPPTTPPDAMFAPIAGSVQRMSQDLESAMHSLAIERDRFEAVLETMAPAVLALDAMRRITSANRSARTLFGIPKNSEHTDLVDVLRVPSLHAFVDDVVGGGPTEIEFELPGAQRHILARASKLGDGGLVIVAEDTTEIRRLERVRQDFVANVSHELRTPIAVIRANAETLLDGALETPKTAEPFVIALFRHADRLGRLVAELLDISALEAGSRVLAVEDFDVADLAHEVIAAHAQAAAERGLSVAHEIPAELWVRGDYKATEQVLFNILDNSIKYGREGGSVDIRAVPAGGAVRLEIRDDGPGIEPQHRARIFERFYRVDSGRSRDAGGTGLGLSIAKHLIEAMGGSIGVEPSSPRGSVFWFALPHGVAPEP